MITTTKNIDLALLDAELGSHGLSMESVGNSKTIKPNAGSPVTAAQLESAIEAHQTTYATKKAEQDAIAAQEAKDLASAEAKLLSYGLNTAEIKAYRKAK